MSQQLISHSPDLCRLRQEGYEITLHGGFLLIHHVPYVNSEKMVQYGMLITSLCLSGTRTARPDNHVIFFDGGPPCHRDGKVITAIQHSDAPQSHGGGLTSQRSFSNRPSEGYPDYYEKVVTYVNILGSPAASLDSSATAKTYRAVPDTSEKSPFCYPDTNTSRAGIGAVSHKLEGLNVGIIGLGGTGAYILDLVAKTPVASIHTFDGDPFLQHNAFRSPGAPALAELEGPPGKVAYFQAIYGRMHGRIVAHPQYLTGVNADALDGLQFVFLCVDKNGVRKILMEELIKRQIPFIDCGIGVELVGDELIGMVRVTLVTERKQDHIEKRIALEDKEDDLYASNIQIAELNMLAAALAVIQWKKRHRFYQDLNREHNSVYTINSHQLDDTDHTAEIC